MNDTMKIKRLGKILIIPSILALSPMPLWAQVDSQTTRPQRDSSKMPAGGGDAAVTGQSDTDVRQSGGQKTPPSSAGMAASSQEIAKLQQALKDRGQDPGTINGVMTPQTQQALRAFQAQQGLNATGTLDAQSRTALGLGLGGGSSGAGAANNTGTGLGTPIDPTLTPGQDTAPGATSRGTAAPSPSGLGSQSPSGLPGGTGGTGTGGTMGSGGTGGSAAGGGAGGAGAGGGK